MSNFHMADVMRRCIMTRDAPKHQAPKEDANNYGMYEQVREIIKEQMRLHGVESERQLALSCDMQQSTLNRFLKGQTDMLQFTHIQSIAQFFGLTVSQLIGETPIYSDAKIQAVVKAMQAMPEYKKDVLVATSQTLANPPSGST